MGKRNKQELIPEPKIETVTEEAEFLVPGTNLTPDEMAKAMEKAAKNGDPSPHMYSDDWWDQWDPFA